MRIIELITEITRLPPYRAGTSDINQAASREGVDKILAAAQPLEGTKWSYAIMGGRSYTTVYMIDPSLNKIIGAVELKQSYAPDKAISVDNIIVSNQYRKQGVASSMYKVALTKMGGHPLIAGSEQSAGGQRNWISLFGTPGVDVKGYIQIADNAFDPVNPNAPKIPPRYREEDVPKGDLDDVIERVMNAGGEYWGTSEGGNSHYFLFPVTPGKTSLTPALANTFKIYDVYEDIIGRPGLVAFWKGK